MFGRILFLVFLVTACSPKPKHNFEVDEDARIQAKENALMLAKQYRADNKMPDWDIYARGDSTISSTCPQGDGWASIDMKRGYDEIIKLKCSTISRGIGCMTSEDFKTKSYANEDGKCNPDVPHPLPKIAN